MTQSPQTRLYFTAEKICIGSYNEVHLYEQRTAQSYWASDFFNLPPNYVATDKTLNQIQADIRQFRRQRFLAKYGKS